MNVHFLLLHFCTEGCIFPLQNVNFSWQLSYNSTLKSVYIKYIKFILGWSQVNVFFFFFLPLTATSAMLLPPSAISHRYIPSSSTPISRIVSRRFVPHSSIPYLAPGCSRLSSKYHVIGTESSGTSHSRTAKSLSHTCKSFSGCLNRTGGSDVTRWKEPKKQSS